MSNFCSGMPLRKVHELTFLWFGLPGPLLIFGGALLNAAGVSLLHHPHPPPAKGQASKTPSPYRGAHSYTVGIVALHFATKPVDACLYSLRLKELEEDKCATTNVQNRFVKFFLLPFLLFVLLELKPFVLKGKVLEGKF